MKVLSGRAFLYGACLWACVASASQPCFSQVPAAPPEETYRQAFSLYQKGDYQGALGDCQAVLSQNPDHWMALQLAGYSAYQLKDVQGAAGYCRRSLALHPENKLLRDFLDKIAPPAAPALPPAPSAPSVPPPPADNQASPSIPTPLPSSAPPVAVHFGFEGGANLANISFNSQGYKVTGLDYRFGFSGGLALRLDFGPVFSLQPELLFTQKGFVFDAYYYSSSYVPIALDQITVSFDYLEMPILFKCSVPSPARPNIFAGISLGVNVNASIADSIQKVSAPYPSGYINPFEAAVILGLGCDIGRFSISGRFEQGLTSLYNNAPVGAVAVQNQGFNFMVGFFPI